MKVVIEDVAVEGTAHAIPVDVLITDDRLQDVAAQPAEDLFPAMAPTSAVAPWLIVFSFLPVIYGVMVWSLNDYSSRWALRALRLLQAARQDVAVTWFAPWTAHDPTSALPPLMTWLTSGMMWVFGTESRISLVGVSCLAVAGTVFSAAKLGCRLGTPRLGWLTALCCAGHPLLLNCVKNSGPEPLGLCLMTFSAERFFAHRDSSVGAWSGQLIVSGLAFGGCWLAIGWPAAALGIALTIYAVGLRFFANPLQSADISATRNLERSLIVWWIIGLLSGSGWLWGAVRTLGWENTWHWLLDPTANPLSPFYPVETHITRWGATIGLTYLMGWLVLGIAALLSQRMMFASERHEGRMGAVLAWWIVLLICRAAVLPTAADPTVWDVLQTVPACVFAASGMELVLQRKATLSWFMAGIVAGLVSLVLHTSRLNTASMHWSLFAATMICVVPMIRNLLQKRFSRWREEQFQRALWGLLLSTWIAHLAWGISQSFAGSPVEVRLAAQLSNLKQSIAPPSAIVVVTDTPPTPALEFQLRRNWPAVPYVVADRWESAVSQSLPKVGNWSSAEFLVVELTRRDSQFRRPGAGWIVTQAGEPRRYRGDKLTMHRVSIRSP